MDGKRQLRDQVYLVREEARGMAIFPHAQSDQIEGQGSAHRMSISGGGRFGPQHGGNEVDIRRRDRDPLEPERSTGKRGSVSAERSAPRPA